MEPLLFALLCFPVGSPADRTQMCLIWSVCVLVAVCPVFMSRSDACTHIKRAVCFPVGVHVKLIGQKFVQVGTQKNEKQALYSG